MSLSFPGCLDPDLHFHQINCIYPFLGLLWISIACSGLLINYVIVSGQNVDSMIFKEVMHELARKLGHLGKDFTDT